MIAGLLMRHYKNFANVRFVPLMDNTDHKFTVYIGNNGVGKSAILEALDLVLNGHRAWNVTQNEKKTEAFICPLFLIPKSTINPTKRTDIEIVSNYFWSDELDSSSVIKSTAALKEFVQFKKSLKAYEKTHYLVLVGSSNDISGAFFSSSFDAQVKKLLGEDSEEQVRRSNALKDMIINKYSYLYIPVEESPTELLQLQNETMQKLLNKNIQDEIEKILNRKQERSSIVRQINRNLDSFINDVNDIISQLDPDYSFAAEGSGGKKNLTAKDIRAKVIEAFFPLRTLKKGNRRVDLLSSGEQRKAIIDVAYSTLIANKDNKTERNIILAIDEPEISMHISNCFNQFSRLEELSCKDIQVIVTTHWYGYLPIAQNGMMHYLEQNNGQTKIRSFNLYNLLESRRNYPDDVQLKSMFDLASSLVSYMRREFEHKWIFCEGSDDKIYLQTMLGEYRNLHIIPLGGCGNVVKLYQILVSFISEKVTDTKPDALFLIDTDINRVSIREPFKYSTLKPAITIRRLQIINNTVNMVDPMTPGIYSQTEMEDCLNPEIYYSAIEKAISNTKNRTLKTAFKKYEFVSDAPTSVVRGDDSCIRATDTKFIPKKQEIIDYIENDENKKTIALIYSSLCEGKTIQHSLADLIVSTLGLEKK